MLMRVNRCDLGFLQLLGKHHCLPCHLLSRQDLVLQKLLLSFLDYSHLLKKVIPYSCNLVLLRGIQILR